MKSVVSLDASRTERVHELADAVVTEARRWGVAIDVDAHEILTARSRLTGWRPTGAMNAGGSCRLVRCRHDRWVALNLARPDDRALLPIVVGVDGDLGDPSLEPDDVVPWTAIDAALSTLEADDVLARATEVGLPFSILGETPVPTSIDDIARLTDFGSVRESIEPSSWRVADLSSLWAGPLVGHFVTRLGGRVSKIESVTRPDGARFGPRAFYESLHAGQNSTVVDFRTPEGRARLRDLVFDSDIVIESSRSRALRQLGVDLEEALSVGRTRVWLSITAHGYSSMRVGFGDDAAVAGGLVDRDVVDGENHHPVFVGDAVADPLTGLMGAAEVMAAMASGRRRHVDLALASTAAWVAGPRR